MSGMFDLHGFMLFAAFGAPKTGFSKRHYACNYGSFSTKHFTDLLLLLLAAAVIVVVVVAAAIGGGGVVNFIPYLNIQYSKY